MKAIRPCPYCGKPLHLTDNLRESIFHCPHCDKRLALAARPKPFADAKDVSEKSIIFSQNQSPDAPILAEMIEEQDTFSRVQPNDSTFASDDAAFDDSIDTYCPCGNCMSAPYEKSGQKINCSRCGKPIYVSDLALVDRLHESHPRQTDFASHPGAVHFELLRYLRYFPVTLYIAILTLVLGLVASYFIGFWAVIPVSIVLAILVYRWRQDKMCMACGDLCATKILSLDPLLLAAFTDLSITCAYYPAIEVIKCKLHDIYGQPLQIGMCLASVASYCAGFEPTDHWKFVFPVPIPCCVSDSLEHEQALLRIEQSEWDALDSKISLLPHPLKPGLYSVPDGATAAIFMDSYEERSRPG